MAEYEPLRPRKGAYDTSPSAVHFVKKNGWLVAAVAWTILSIYPVFVFLFPSTSNTLVSVQGIPKTDGLDLIEFPGVHKHESTLQNRDKNSRDAVNRRDISAWGIVGRVG